MHVDIWVHCEAGYLKLTHFIIESLGMTRVKHTVIEPNVGHFVKERIRQKGRVRAEVGEVESDLVLKQVSKAEFLFHLRGKAQSDLWVDRAFRLIREERQKHLQVAFCE